MEQLYERERIFCSHVIEKIEDAIQKSPKSEIIILFDIDDTIAKVITNIDIRTINALRARSQKTPIGTTGYTSVRPSFIMLAQYIKDTYPNVRIGIMSTHSQI